MVDIDFERQKRLAKSGVLRLCSQHPLEFSELALGEAKQWSKCCDRLEEEEEEAAQGEADEAYEADKTEEADVVEDQEEDRLPPEVSVPQIPRSWLDHTEGVSSPQTVWGHVGEIDR